MGKPMSNDNSPQHVAELHKRVMQLEGVVRQQAARLEELETSVEDRAIGLIELLCTSVIQQIKEGRERALTPAPKYEFAMVSEESPESELTMTIVDHDETGVTVYGKLEDGRTIEYTQGPVADLAKAFIAQHSIGKEAPVRVNLFKLSI